MNIPRDDTILFEVGAYDGLTYSNTFALEQFSNCRCILIEPSPINVRKAFSNRPKASIYSMAIMDEFGVCEFLGDAPISGVASQLTADYRETWKLDQARRYNVLGLPFSVVMQLEKIAYID